MSLFGRKTMLLEETSFCLGELNYEIFGGYDNVKTFPLHTKVGKQVTVSIETSAPIDVSVVDGTGLNQKFKEGFTGGTIGPLPVKEKGIMTLILGIWRGDRSDVTVSAWME
ncbi:MAG: hypothetical protein J6O90_04390 [Candidatus Methanomethylophilaceae archaeon]|nr:hypothetical protein [Candidatus Methanomethylophilaceae archaeon]